MNIPSLRASNFFFNLSKWFMHPLSTGIIIWLMLDFSIISYEIRLSFMCFQLFPLFAIAILATSSSHSLLACLRGSNLAGFNIYIVICIRNVFKASHKYILIYPLICLPYCYDDDNNDNSNCNDNNKIVIINFSFSVSQTQGQRRDESRRV